MLTNIALIPIRSGSKRFPGKNTYTVNGMPLFCIAGLIALKSGAFDSVWIASDGGSEVEAICKHYGFNYFNRSGESARDYAQTEAVIQEFIKSQAIVDEDAWLTVIQATCPFQHSKYFNRLKKLIEDSDSSFSSIMTRVEFKRFYADEVLNPLFSRARTQDLPIKYLETGLFWAFRTKSFVSTGLRVSHPVGFIEIDHGDDWDIDTKSDFNKCYHRLKSIVNGLHGYYKRRPFILTEDYYVQATDPDGRNRDMIQENQGRLDFAFSEIKKVNAYLDHISNTIPLCTIKILDVGCGNGVIGEQFKRKNTEVHGIEPSERGAHIAKTRLDEVYCGTYETSPYFTNGNQYDVIFAFHVIEHIENPEHFVSSAYKALKNGGLFVVATPDFESTMAKIYGDKFRLLHDKTHISLFGTLGLCSLLNDSGFSVSEIDYPFVGTKFCTKENLEKLLTMQNVSPPFSGNVMTIYANKD